MKARFCGLFCFPFWISFALHEGIEDKAAKTKKPAYAGSVVEIHPD